MSPPLSYNHDPSGGQPFKAPGYESTFGSGGLGDGHCSVARVDIIDAECVAYG